MSSSSSSEGRYSPMKFVSQALKAFYAATVTFLTGLGTVLVGTATLGDVTTSQWVAIASGALIAFGAVYGVTNAK